MILFLTLKDLSLEAFVAGITNVSFTKTVHVAVSLNEAGPFALRIFFFMDDTEAMALSRAYIFKIISCDSRRSLFLSEP